MEMVTKSNNFIKFDPFLFRTIKRLLDEKDELDLANKISEKKIINNTNLARNSTLVLAYLDLCRTAIQMSKRYKEPEDGKVWIEKNSEKSKYLTKKSMPFLNQIFEEVVACTRKQMTEIREKLIELGLIETHDNSHHRRTSYWLNLEKLNSHLEEQLVIEGNDDSKANNSHENDEEEKSNDVEKNMTDSESESESQEDVGTTTYELKSGHVVKLDANGVVIPQPGNDVDSGNYKKIYKSTTEDILEAVRRVLKSNDDPQITRVFSMLNGMKKEVKPESKQDVRKIKTSAGRLREAD